MKRIALLIIAIIILCLPAYADDKLLIYPIYYIKDPYGLCYAYISHMGYRGPSITYIPCDKVPPGALYTAKDRASWPENAKYMYIKPK